MLKCQEFFFNLKPLSAKHFPFFIFCFLCLSFSYFYLYLIHMFLTVKFSLLHNIKFTFHLIFKFSTIYSPHKKKKFSTIYHVPKKKKNSAQYINMRLISLPKKHSILIHVKKKKSVLIYVFVSRDNQSDKLSKQYFLDICDPAAL